VPSEQNPHILAIDDNVEFKDALKSYLAQHDYCISLAENAAAAETKRAVDEFSSQ
jgi:DNA-binding response OmpR family regulator